MLSSLMKGVAERAIDANLSTSGGNPGMREADIREALARESSEYRALHDQHRDFETRLSELARKPFLNTQEQVERTNIKKHKLRLKDQMEELARRLLARR